MPPDGIPAATLDNKTQMAALVEGDGRSAVEPEVALFWAISATLGEVRDPVGEREVMCPPIPFPIRRGKPGCGVSA